MRAVKDTAAQLFADQHLCTRQTRPCVVIRKLSAKCGKRVRSAGSSCWCATCSGPVRRRWSWFVCSLWERSSVASLVVNPA